jgi:hypothetical protein
MGDERTETSTDAFLLTLDETAFLDVAAIIGLRARVTEKDDTDLVEAFLGSDTAFLKARRPMLVTSVPGILPQ